MCGLMAAIDSNEGKKQKSVNRLIIDIYQDQYKRGQEGFGILSLDKKNKIQVDRATEPTKFMFDIHNIKSPFILAHHRWPTSTSNKVGQTHPILVSNKKLKFDYYVMHNGVIRNCDELKEMHNKLGFEYTTEIEDGMYTKTLKFNDSESMAIEMALFLEGIKSTVEFKGSAAFLILQIDKKTKKVNKFFYGRHVNPLNIYRKNGVCTIASEGKGIELEEDIVYSLEMKKGAKPKEQELIFPEVVIEPKTVYPNSSIYPNLAEASKSRPTQAGTKPQNTLWTKEDEEEDAALYSGIGGYDDDLPVGSERSKLLDEEDEEVETDLEMRLEFLPDEIYEIIDPFILALGNEGTAYTANIESILLSLKVTLKDIKREAILGFRKKPALLEEPKATMGFTTQEERIKSEIMKF